VSIARIVRLDEKVLEEISQIFDGRRVGGHVNPDVGCVRQGDRPEGYQVEEASMLSKVRIETRDVNVQPPDALGQRLGAAAPELVVGRPDPPHLRSLWLRHLLLLLSAGLIITEGARFFFDLFEDSASGA